MDKLTLQLAELPSAQIEALIAACLYPTARLISAYRLSCAREAAIRNAAAHPALRWIEATR